jgi:hypothetical protein
VRPIRDSLVLASDWLEWEKHVSSAEHAIRTVGPSWVSWRYLLRNAPGSGMYACAGSDETMHEKEAHRTRAIMVQSIQL